MKDYIDPFYLEHEHLLNLFIKLIETYPKQAVFIGGESYQVGKNKLVLTHTVLRKGSVQNTSSYQILSNEALARSSKTRVYLIPKILLIIQNKCAYFQPFSPLIAKVISVRKNEYSEIKKCKDIMMHEYEQSEQGHLVAEKPIYNTLASTDKTRKMHYKFFGVAVQRKMPGIELFNLLKYFLDGLHGVTFHLRLMLIFQLLEAFNSQVLQQRKVHGDLKPENFIVDIGHYDVRQLIHSHALEDERFNPIWPMYVIDFEAAYDFNVIRPILSVTSGYTAPEIEAAIARSSIRPPAVDEKEDMFSIAKIIVIILGFSPDISNNFKNISFRARQIERIKPLYPNEPEAFSSSILSCVFAAINNFTDPEPSTRWSFNQVYNFFQGIQAKYKQIHSVQNIENSSGLVDVAEVTVDAVEEYSDTTFSATF